MKKFLFIKKNVELETLVAHPLLIEWGFDFKPDEHFARVLKIYGLYEMPVVDSKGNVITHLADVLAAIKNGETHMDVYEIDMDDVDLKLFIFLKHKYHKDKQMKSYEAAKFFRNYLEKDSEGKKLAKTLTGDINKKVGQLMQTSDSTIKRLLKVGDLKPQYLGMIDNNNLSFHDAEAKIKTEKLTEKHKKKKLEANNEKDEPIRQQEEEKGSSDIKKPSTTTIEVPINYFHVDDEVVSYGMEQGEPFIEIGGKKLKNVIHETHMDSSSEHGVRVSHIFQEKKSNGKSIQIVFENFSKAA